MRESGRREFAKPRLAHISGCTVLEMSIFSVDYNTQYTTFTVFRVLKYLGVHTRTSVRTLVLNDYSLKDTHLTTNPKVYRPHNVLH